MRGAAGSVGLDLELDAAAAAARARLSKKFAMAQGLVVSTTTVGGNLWVGCGVGGVDGLFNMTLEEVAFDAS
jgi:hypothetical protein